MTSPEQPRRSNTVGRALATAGVILSLVFVALELRQNTAASRAQTRQGLADRNAQVANSIAENPELARAWSTHWIPGAPDSARLSRTDSTQAHYAMVGMIRHMENVYLQYLEGTVDPTVLDSYGFRTTGILFTTPQFRDFWVRFRGSVDPRFATAFAAEYGLP